jgi:aryl-alcohol dehydrogenase-like predicted oxidoreductase
MTSLATRPLGRSGLEITVIGAGSWAIGGAEWKYNWGPQDDSSSVRALRHAVELGVNWIDTAAVYGRGHSEEVVGRAIAGLPAGERPFIFTKCGLRTSNSDPFGEPQRCLRPDSVRQECDASLQRLGIERIDLYQFHWPDNSGVAVEDSWGEMSRLIAEGKVRAGGVSNFDIALLERCEKIHHVDSLQPPLSLINRLAGADLLSWCAANGTGVISYSPMQAGLFSDSFSAERVALMDRADWRLWHQEFSHFSPPALQRNLAMRDRLRPIAKRHDATVASVAISWVLSWPGVTGAIVGSRSPDQVDGWIGAGALTLSDEDLDEIEVALIDLGVGVGPTRPAKSALVGGSHGAEPGAHR